MRGITPISDLSFLSMQSDNSHKFSIIIITSIFSEERKQIVYKIIKDYNVSDTLSQLRLNLANEILDIPS